MNGWKKVGVIFSIIVVVGGTAMGYGELKQKAATSESQIEEIKEESKDIKEAIQENTLINVKQTAVLQHITETLTEIKDELKR